MNPELGERLQLVQQRIRSAAAQAGRSESDLTLVVVTKNHPAQLVLDLIDLGATDFGENRDQEAAPKALQVAESLAASESMAPPNWHFVGQLQSNKVRSVLRYASAIHSLDRASLLEALAKETAKAVSANPVDVFIELNLTDDAGRGGLNPEQLEGFAEQVLAVPGLQLRGVMGVATLEHEAERDFDFIRSCSQRLQRVAPKADRISAGMSQDFETAIRFGATHLRIGTAITGERQY